MMGNHSAAMQETRDEPDVEWLTYADARKIENEVDHRRDALRKMILGGDYDAAKAMCQDWGDDYASDFVRAVIGLVGYDEPDTKTAELRYWLIRKAVERWLAPYLEAAIDERAVEDSMREEGLL